mmetsp:Transcript_9713/g.17513  ORF Transcript_9713/g.17513 Transcript_9713/m.17513 type:complete len:206 (+) Transcript_9713:1520-2137(+)
MNRIGSTNKASQEFQGLSARNSRALEDMARRWFAPKPEMKEPVKQGQESCWDYPRPPICERVAARVQVFAHGNVCVADSVNAKRILETYHPPTYYIPKQDLKHGMGCRIEADKGGRSTFCEYKGVATYWNVIVNGRVYSRVGWSYESPTEQFDAIRGHVAFNASLLEKCMVGGEVVVPQAGGFYAGWITSTIKGPFKGAPGTEGW